MCYSITGDCSASSDHLEVILQNWGHLHSRQTGLTPKHRETHGCIVSTADTDGLVLKQRAISIHNADYTFIVFDQLHIKILHLWCTTLENKIILWKKWPSRVRVKPVSEGCCNAGYQPKPQNLEKFCLSIIYVSVMELLRIFSSQLNS